MQVQHHGSYVRPWVSLRFFAAFQVKHVGKHAGASKSLSKSRVIARKYEGAGQGVWEGGGTLSYGSIR